MLSGPLRTASMSVAPLAGSPLAGKSRSPCGSCRKMACSWTPHSLTQRRSGVGRHAVEHELGARTAYRPRFAHGDEIDGRRLLRSAWTVFALVANRARRADVGQLRDRFDIHGIRVDPRPFDVGEEDVGAPRSRSCGSECSVCLRTRASASCLRRARCRFRPCAPAPPWRVPLRRLPSRASPSRALPVPGLSRRASFAPAALSQARARLYRAAR